MKKSQIDKLVEAQKLIIKARELIGEVAFSPDTTRGDYVELRGYCQVLNQVLGAGAGLQGFCINKLTKGKK